MLLWKLPIFVTHLGDVESDFANFIGLGLGLGLGRILLLGKPDQHPGLGELPPASGHILESTVKAVLD